MFTLENLSKSFGVVRVLDGFCLAMAPQKTTVLIGPSGCGKSTLLRLMLGLIAPDSGPDSGQVLFDGTPVGPANAPTLRRRMGYVLQGGGLFPHLTARANASLMARHIGLPPDDIARRTEEIAARVRLSPDLLERYPAQLSGGQRQRVALMRALMLDPDVLLLDEPFGALDPMVRYQLQTDLREIFQDLGKTVVLVTHDIGEAAFFGDEIVLMRAGRIVQRGGIVDMVERPTETFVENFVTAQRTLLDSLAT